MDPATLSSPGADPKPGGEDPQRNEKQQHHCSQRRRRPRFPAGWYPLAALQNPSVVYPLVHRLLVPLLT